MTEFEQEYPNQTAHQKLIKLLNLVKSKSAYKSMDRIDVEVMISNLNTVNFLTKEEMVKANILWQKYK